jgi:membrane glycosyltransferase
MWLVFLLVGILISLQAQFIRPEYFPSGFSLFPQWPAQDPVRAAWVFAGTMGLLVLPKLLGYAALLARQDDRRGCGGSLRAFVSLLIETLVSGLIAPMMMVMQSVAVIDILLGRDSGWQVQRRDDGTLPLRALVGRYLGHTFVGVLLAAAAFAVSLPLFLWMTPVIVGLVLAIPLAAVTADPAFGRFLRRLGLLTTPEERAPPDVLRRGNALARVSAESPAPIVRLLRDPQLMSAHRAMLPKQPRRRGEIDVALVVGLAKLDEMDTLTDALENLSRDELAALLGDEHGLDRLVALAGR